MSGRMETTDDRASQTRKLTDPVYVFGVIPAADAAGWPETAGLNGPSSTVRAVAEGVLAALVSDLPPGHTPGRREDLEAHQRVLSLAIEHGTTMPMRFGMVFDGDEEVRQRLLARHATELGKLLAHLDGRVQMMVKAFYVEDALLADVLAAHPDLARESSALAGRPQVETHAARVRVGELLAGAIEARRAEVESAMLDRLAVLCADIEMERPTSDRVAFSAHLLVDRDSRGALDETIRELGETLAGVLAFRYVGPLPPYSFANLSLEGDDEQWAS
jgi:hypothetical protein